ncbi:hypothetical protein PHAVU_004G062700 [Phaseolus vulgaris]|uniref:Uncharacterized protein n=1 Tax=Phaseolus vulgaris TaxID=3885 RepID=V7C0B2_PHAVU|nr:hypothetical protein PHAVU_004G062700g [Phaseolus vulgaris]ESW23617.1 hypothetical protein PHAVU_004G062700g [Phaseolus vulgaris]
MDKWLKRQTHHWRMHRFNSYWMHANGTLPPKSLPDFCTRMKSYGDCPVHPLEPYHILDSHSLHAFPCEVCAPLATP